MTGTSTRSRPRVGDVAAVVDWAGEGVSVLGHSYGGVCALEACLLTDNMRRLVLYEPPLGFLTSPPSVVQRLHELLEAGERDEVIAFFMQEVAGLTAEQVDAMRAMPAWEARLAVAHTIPREERANREYRFDPDRFRTVAVPTLFLEGGDSPEPFKQAGEAVRRRWRTAGSASWRGSGTTRWTWPPTGSRPRCWASWRRARGGAALGELVGGLGDTVESWQFQPRRARRSLPSDAGLQPGLRAGAHGLAMAV